MEIIIYITIFSQKIIENALSSFRAIVYTAGHKHLGAFIVGVNTLIWIIVVSLIIKDLTDDPFKIIIYGLGQVFGGYIGMIIEEKLALGNSLLYIVIKKENGEKIINNLRSEGFGVTSVNARGYANNEKYLLLIACKRKDKIKVKEIIGDFEEEVVIMSKTPSNFIGGYVS